MNNLVPKKKIRLIELFSGYGSQALALKYLGVDFESWRTCEWAVKSIQAYKDIHFKDDNTNYSKDLTKEQLIEFLYKKGISSNYNEPMTEQQIKRLGEDKLRTIYNNIKATHNMVNIQQVHSEDLEIKDVDKFEYLVTYSYPCQDLSLAGKQEGMKKGSGTRSGMLWEVERILDECKELGTLPQVLCMENVSQVHGTKNISDFNMWIDKLNSLGYTSDWADLNTKNYGVPQNRNRTFMVSRLNTTQHFNFPKPITLVNKLKDLLEDEVEEKYYLSDNIVSKLKISDDVKEKIGVDLNDKKSELREITSTIKARYDCGYEHFTPGPTGVAEPTLEKLCNDSSGNNFNAIYDENDISRTLLARDYKDPMRVATELKQIGQMYPSSGNPQAGRIYASDGLSPCLDTCTGGNREVKVLEEPFICASRGRNPDNPNCRDKGQELEQRLEPKFDGTSNCLTTVTKDNYVCEPTCSPLQKEVCNKALEFMKPNDSIDYTYSNSRLKEMESGYIKTKNSEDNNIMNTVTTNADSFGVCVEDNLKKQLCNKLIENGMVEEEDVIRHSYTNNRLSNGEKNMGRIESKEKLCPTLDTRCDCLGVCVSGPDRFDSNMFSSFSSTEKKLFTEDGNIKRYINSDVVDEFKEGQMATTSFPNGYRHGPRTHNESIALNTIDKPCVKKNLRIRKLTPNECFRLQGVSDDDFRNCAINQSNASLYHLAGDSITTTTLMAIFGTLLSIDWKQKAVEQGLIKVSENDIEREMQPILEKFSWDI